MPRFKHPQMNPLTAMNQGSILATDYQPQRTRESLLCMDLRLPVAKQACFAVTPWG